MGKTIIIQCIRASLSMAKTITIYSSQKVVVVELCTWATGLESDAKCKPSIVGAPPVAGKPLVRFIYDYYYSIPPIKDTTTTTMTAAHCFETRCTSNIC